MSIMTTGLTCAIRALSLPVQIATHRYMQSLGPAGEKDVEKDREGVRVEISKSPLCPKDVRREPPWCGGPILLAGH